MNQSDYIQTNDVPEFLADAADPLLWSVDRSWANVRANSDGDLYASDSRKLHVDRGDSTAKCSRRILLNSLQQTAPGGFTGGGLLYADQPAGRVSEVEPGLVCRRCVPKVRR